LSTATATTTARAVTRSAAHGASDVVLRDGSTVCVRRVRANDEQRLVTFLHGLSEQSRLLRFFSAGANLDEQAHSFADADGLSGYGLVATLGTSGEIVGHAGYARESPQAAEVAFAIADAFQGLGLATTLLARLAAHASAHRIATFTAWTRPDNNAMIDVFRESGFAVEFRSDGDVVTVRFSTRLSATGWCQTDPREQVAPLGSLPPTLAGPSVRG
jgi:RimJ/RimL family protein N-acetyltransferase